MRRQWGAEGTRRQTPTYLVILDMQVLPELPGSRDRYCDCSFERPEGELSKERDASVVSM